MNIKSEAWIGACPRRGGYYIVHSTVLILQDGTEVTWTAGIPSARTYGGQQKAHHESCCETRWSSHTKLADSMGNTTVAGQCLMMVCKGEFEGGAGGGDSQGFVSMMLEPS